MYNSEIIRNMADQCERDPAMIAGIAHALRHTGLAELCGFTPPPLAREGPPPPFPHVAQITAIQTSIFDNWPMGKPIKGVPSRYGAAVEVWTCNPEKISVVKGRKPNWQHKSQMALMDAANLKRQVADIRRKPRRHPVCSDWLDALAMLADGIEGTDFVVGLVNTNIIDDSTGYDRGRYYHANQALIVEITAGEVRSARLMTGDTIDLAPFSTRDAGGNPLARNVMAQSRDDRLQAMTGSWATNQTDD